MTIHELDISWAATAGQRRSLHWQLLTCKQVRGVFLTARDDTLAVLFDGDRSQFHDWARTLAGETTHTSRTTHEPGALP
jgi:hypothetical protein